MITKDEIRTTLSDIRFYYAKAINHNHSQAIFTTHNTRLLDENLRVDQIFTVNKNDLGVSTLSPLEDVNNKTPRKVHKLSERYIDGLYGGIPDIKFEEIKNIFM